jgi:hypothetical protein
MIHTGELRREFKAIDLPESPARRHGFVLPGDTKEIERVYVPEADVSQSILHLPGDEFGMNLLLEGGNQDLPFPRLPDRLFQFGLILAQVNHGRASFSFDRSMPF